MAVAHVGGTRTKTHFLAKVSKKFEVRRAAGGVSADEKRCVACGTVLTTSSSFSFFLFLEKFLLTTNTDCELHCASLASAAGVYMITAHIILCVGCIVCVSE